MRGSASHSLPVAFHCLILRGAKSYPTGILFSYASASKPVLHHFRRITYLLLPAAIGNR
jgi:hypothetical protein